MRALLFCILVSLCLSDSPSSSSSSSSSSDLIKPFKIDVDNELLDDLRLRLQMTRLPTHLDEEKSWTRGTSLAFTKELLEYWKNSFDWRLQEKKLNELPQFTTTIDEYELHFVHARSPHALAQPLVVVHGWPGSFFECNKILPMLTDPVAYGGTPEDAFHVVCPSLPGYGFSKVPPNGALDQYETADIFDKLMKRLGYDKYWAQGGDWGTMVATLIADNHVESVIGLHLNLPLGNLPFSGVKNSLWSLLVLAMPNWMLSEEDALAFKRYSVSKMWDMTGYMHLQSTKPQTLSYGLNDSPIGLATYIIEKFYEWSDCTGDVQNRFTKDELLTNVMIYWITESIATSVNYYYEFMHSEKGFLYLDTIFVEVPTGIAIFPGEKFPGDVKVFSKSKFNLQRWTRMEKGGHFAALEEPFLLVQDVRAFRRQLEVEWAKQNSKSEI